MQEPGSEFLEIKTGSFKLVNSGPIIFLFLNTVTA